MEIDLHGKNLYQARIALSAVLRRATAADYALIVIHGYQSGQAIKEMIQSEFASHPKVLRIRPGANPGQTVLVLREIC